MLEDNLRIPSGASYPMIARSLCRKASPSTFKSNHIYDNRNYAEMLKTTMDYVNTGGINVILTPGRFNAAYFEHSYLAEQTNSILATGNDLVVESDYLYYVEYGGTKEKVGAVYRRISDEYLDPMTFCEESLIGVPHIFDVYRKGNVALINAPGNGVADDKGIYYFVPKIIKYYLGEEAVLHNAPTYLPFYEDDMKYVMENLSKLVIKDVAEAGGYGVVFGDSLTQEELEDFRQAIIAEPRRFIAQEVVDFLTWMFWMKMEQLYSGKRIMVIPTINTFSMNIGKRFWPTDNTDINRMFPGYNLGETTQRIAAGVFEEIQNYEYGIQFASNYISGDFIPHVRMMKTGFENVKLAEKFGLPYVVLRNQRPYDTTTLNYNWQIWETNAFSVYTCDTEKIDMVSAMQAIEAVLVFLSKGGLLYYNAPEAGVSEVIDESALITVKSQKAGIFIPRVDISDRVETGTVLAEIINPYEGEILEEIKAPQAGTVFFMQDNPMILSHAVAFRLI